MSETQPKKSKFAFTEEPIRRGSSEGRIGLDLRGNFHRAADVASDVSAREIARRAGGKSRHREDPHWAAPLIAKLLEQKVIETDSAHNYRLIIKQDRKRKHWISPQMKKILESGGNFTHIIEDEDLPPEGLPSRVLSRVVRQRLQMSREPLGRHIGHFFERAFLFK